MFLIVGQNRVKRGANSQISPDLCKHVQGRVIFEIFVIFEISAPLFIFNPRRKLTMARGQQKIQSQAKAQEKAKKLAKANGPDQKKSAQAALQWQCSVCKSQMPDPKTYKQHFESKHPKAPLPDELKDQP